MTNDTKLGTVVGVGLVITLAVLFFQKEVPSTDDPAKTPPESTMNVTETAPPAALR